MRTRVTVAALMSFGLLAMAPDHTAWIAEARMPHYLPCAQTQAVILLNFL